MSVIIENETNKIYDFDYIKLIEDVVNASLEYINCPYEACISVTLVNSMEIQKINNEYRNINKETDVLSFPMIEYKEPGNFSELEEETGDEYFDPDTGELVLGDIVLCVNRIDSQAKEYGHSVKREMAFLTAHSMFHLFGFDHMENDERIQMENMQEEVLQKLGITRDDISNICNELIKLATDAMKFSYSPYSEFKVGAAIEASNNNGDKKIFTGCNVENASFGATVCAERTAMTKAVSEGYYRIINIAVVGSNHKYTYPCGICRQFLLEFATDNTKVFLYDKINNHIKEIDFKELIPDGFFLVK